jgi:hypothetical protein
VNLAIQEDTSARNCLYSVTQNRGFSRLVRELKRFGIGSWAAYLHNIFGIKMLSFALKHPKLYRPFLG